MNSDSEIFPPLLLTLHDYLQFPGMSILPTIELKMLKKLYCKISRPDKGQEYAQTHS